DLERLVYPDAPASINSAWLPASNRGMPHDAAVLAVRTSEGRYAKAALWRDSGGRLHVRFRTYAGGIGLGLSAVWQTSRGEAVTSGTVGLVSYVDYQVARTGLFRIEGGPLVAPVSTTWYWNGEELGSEPREIDGGHVRAQDAAAEVVTNMGGSIRGTLCVRAVDATGTMFETCRDVTAAATERVWDAAALGEVARLRAIESTVTHVAPDPNAVIDARTRFARRPLRDQLRSAIAAGFEVDEELVELP
ncbi:MAG TPA: hypothetical protein VG106_10105, partial [Vicinamibacterales bacterium]|nr:hypothetical protein [Vicinamibacterales bacterium]